MDAAINRRSRGPGGEGKNEGSKPEHTGWPTERSPSRCPLTNRQGAPFRPSGFEQPFGPVITEVFVRSGVIWDKIGKARAPPDLLWAKAGGSNPYFEQISGNLRSKPLFEVQFRFLQVGGSGFPVFRYQGAVWNSGIPEFHIPAHRITTATLPPAVIQKALIS